MGSGFGGTGGEKFPIVWSSFGSFSLSFTKYFTYLRAGWFPLLMYFIASIVVQFVLELVFVSMGMEGNGVLQGVGVVLGIVVSIATYLVMIPTFSAWLRLTIQGPPLDGRFPLWRFGREEWRLFWFLVQVLLVTIAVLLPIAIVAGTQLFGTQPLLDGLLVFIVIAASVLASVYVGSRLAPGYGAAVMGQPVTVVSAWRMSQGHGLRISLAYVLFILTMGLLFLAIGLVLATVAAGIVAPFFVGGFGSAINTMPDLGLFGILGIIVMVIVVLAVYLMSAIAFTAFLGRVYAFLGETDSADLKAFD